MALKSVQIKFSLDDKGMIAKISANANAKALKKFGMSANNAAKPVGVIVFLMAKC